MAGWPEGSDPAAAYVGFASSVLVPLVRDRFSDPAGGFHERLDTAFTPMPVGRKRLLVQCRLLYVLSEAALAGDASVTGAAEAGYAFLRRAYHDARHGGWRFAVAPDGAPFDDHKDLYGHAFVLFALAYLHRAFAAPDALALAAETAEVLRHRLAAPNGGYWERATEGWEPDRTERRQNPHMHLLEAMLALWEASGDTAWRDEAASLVALFGERFYDRASGTLGEFFGPDWSPHPEHGHIVEPGHHFEWVWLLDRWRRLSGRDDGREAADCLFAHALTHGFDHKHGGLHDQVDRTGAVVLATRRIWPVTEAIKATVARGETARADALLTALGRDFLHLGEGRWHETLARNGAVTMTEMPGSTPYHLMMAAAKVARVRGLAWPPL